MEIEERQPILDVTRLFLPNAMGHVLKTSRDPFWLKREAVVAEVAANADFATFQGFRHNGSVAGIGLQKWGGSSSHRTLREPLETWPRYNSPIDQYNKLI